MSKWKVDIWKITWVIRLIGLWSKEIWWIEPFLQKFGQLAQSIFHIDFHELLRENFVKVYTFPITQKDQFS